MWRISTYRQSRLNDRFIDFTGRNIGRPHLDCRQPDLGGQPSHLLPISALQACCHAVVRGNVVLHSSSAASGHHSGRRRLPQGHGHQLLLFGLVRAVFLGDCGADHHLQQSPVDYASLPDHRHHHATSSGGKETVATCGTPRSENNDLI